ncbi:MAG: hypothetical protein IH905_04295 [Proteobacteria bacterium]|nr:hypothetical protein [Pseudomonadota bacterium]
MTFLVVADEPPSSHLWAPAMVLFCFVIVALNLWLMRIGAVAWQISPGVDFSKARPASSRDLPLAPVPGLCHQVNLTSHKGSIAPY